MKIYINRPKKLIPPKTLCSAEQSFETLIKIRDTVRSALYSDIRWIVVAMESTHIENPEFEWLGIMAPTTKKRGNFDICIWTSE